MSRYHRIGEGRFSNMGFDVDLGFGAVAAPRALWSFHRWISSVRLRWFWLGGRCGGSRWSGEVGLGISNGGCAGVIVRI
jgi:hypothetical protein